MTNIPNGTIAGTVIDKSNRQGLADTAVTIVGGPSSAPDIAMLTDDGGRFEISDLATGIWELAALDPSGRAGRTQCEVIVNQTVNCVIEVS